MHPSPLLDVGDAGVYEIDVNRTLVLAEGAKRLEHAIHIMCATPSGYEERVVRAQRVIMNAAKGVDKRNDAVKEVMECLRQGVEWWHKTQQECVH